MRIKQIFLISIIALGVSFVGARVLPAITHAPGGQSAGAASILSSGEIRAAYTVYPPYFIKDPNTNELSGIVHDIMEEAGKNLGLEIKWTDEVNWANFAEGFTTNRYDIVASGIWATAERAKVVDFTVPLFYNGVGVYVRADDKRFASLERINRPDITIVAIDGEMSVAIARESFPNARLMTLPQDTPASQVLLSVKTRKADVAFENVEIGGEFLARNPGALKNIARDKPIRIFPSAIVLPKNQDELKSMLNVTLEELIHNGTVERIVKKYQKYKDSVYLVRAPYTAQ